MIFDTDEELENAISELVAGDPKKHPALEKAFRRRVSKPSGRYSIGLKDWWGGAPEDVTLQLPDGELRIQDSDIDYETIVYLNEPVGPVYVFNEEIQDWEEV